MAKEYLLYNTVTHETIKLCDDSDSACIAALQEKGYYMLTEERYGDKYQYPAIYKSPGIVWDQSEENKTNGDWTMTSREIEAGEDGSEHSHESEHSQGGLAKGLNYILYNSQTHESYSIPNELSDSGWILLNENAYPDYKHPAVYNTCLLYTFLPLPPIINSLESEPMILSFPFVPTIHIDISF